MSAVLQTPAQPYAQAHALTYVALGWPVLPLALDEKRPAGELAPHGFRQATTGPPAITRWFEQELDAGVGIFPGPARLLIFELYDIPGKPRGFDALAELEAIHGALPATLTQLTPSGGEFRHLVFNLPEGFEPAFIGNRILAVGIDVRCSAGYICAEPSRVRLNDGRLSGYVFDDWDILSGEAPENAESPSWLLGLLGLLTRQETAAGQAAGDAAVPCAARDFATAQQVADQRSPLNFLHADLCDLWIRCGHCLRGLGATGRELWLTWSQQSDNWQAADAWQWDGFAAGHAGIRSVFKAAQPAGLVNPASKAAALPRDLPGARGAKPFLLSRPAFVTVPVEDLDTAKISPQAWAWDGYIPARQVTLLGAHGGTGKSTISLMLAVCVAVDLLRLVVPTRAAPVVFFSGDDDAQTVRHRLRTVCQLLDVHPPELPGRLLVLDASDADPALWVEPGREPLHDGRAASPEAAGSVALRDKRDPVGHGGLDRRRRGIRAGGAA